MRSLRIYVDDYAATFIGKVDDAVGGSGGSSSSSMNCSRERLLWDGVDTAKDIVDTLRRVAGLPTAWDKRKILASDPGAGRDLERHLAAYNFKFRERDAFLGVDAAAGRPTQHRGMRARAKTAARKVSRLGVFRRAGGFAVNMARAIAVGAVTYGAKVNGVPNHILNHLRRMVRRCTSTRAGGSSATLDLMLQRSAKADPAYRANEAPLLKWAAECFNDDQSKMNDMNRAWKHQMAKVALNPKPWTCVAGLAGAVTATLRRIGWDFVAPTACK